MHHRTVPRPPVDADFAIDAATFQMEFNNQSKLLRQCKKGNARKEKTRRLSTANNRASECVVDRVKICLTSSLITHRTYSAQRFFIFS